MNLVLSGPIDRELINEVETLVRPARSKSIRSAALRFEDVLHAREVRTTVKAWCESRRVDHAFVTPAQRIDHFRLLAIDMDSTLIDIECIDELADIAGVGEEVKAITEAAMRGEITDFTSSLRQRVRLLEGLHVDALRQVYEERLKLTPGARELIDKVKSVGMYTLLLSGGFTYFTERLRMDLGLDEAQANILELKNTYLAGSLKPPIFDGNAKSNTLLATLAKLDLSKQTAIVVGDGSNDIPMMKLSGFAVAFHAKPIVRDAAKVTVQFGGLDVILDFLTTNY